MAESNTEPEEDINDIREKLNSWHKDKKNEKRT